MRLLLSLFGHIAALSRCGVAYSCSLSVCLSQLWAMQKWLNWSTCHLVMD